MLASSGLFILALLNFERTRQAETDSLALEAAVAIALSIGALVSARPSNGGIGFTRIFAALFAVFHLGMTWPLPFGGVPKFASKTDASWFYSASLPGSLALAAGFLATVALASNTIQSLIHSREGNGSEIHIRESGVPDHRRQIIGETGALLAVASIVAWFVVSAVTGGLSSGGSYLTYLSNTSGSVLPWIYLLMGISMGALGAGSPFTPKLERLAIIAYLAFSAVAFPLGLRGEVLIPAMAYIATRSRTRYSKIYRWVIPMAVVGLSLGALVAKTRLGQTKVALPDLNPLNALTELGYSLRPLMFVHEWKGKFPGARTGVETYLNPFIRALDPLGIAGTKAASEDQSAFNVFVGQRYGQIGGSILAESFWSGGVVSVAGIAVLVGTFLGFSDSLRSSPVLEAMTGSLVFILLLWVRNTFTPVPGQLAICILFIVFLWVRIQLSEADRPPLFVNRSFGGLHSKKKGRGLKGVEPKRKVSNRESPTDAE